jgi:hypothetical protein
MEAGEESQMTSQPTPPAGPAQQQAARRAEVAMWAIGQPNSIARQFDFWDDSYEGRRLFSEVLGTFFHARHSLAARSHRQPRARPHGSAAAPGRISRYTGATCSRATERAISLRRWRRGTG